MFVYSCTHIYPDTINDRSKLEQVVQQDLARYSTRLEDHDCVILSFLGEGHDDVTIEPLMDYITTMISIDKIGVLFNSSISKFLPYRYQCFEENLVESTNFFQRIDQFDHEWPMLQLDKKFLCLNRNKREIRTQLVHRLIDQLQPESLRASLDSMSTVENKHAIFIDGPVDHIRQHTNVDSLFRSCLFNIVSESSDQSSANVWKSIFITEKTYKAFALRQVPLWMAVPGLVTRVRNLGFDLFDDLCNNHCYDDVQDETDRMHQIVNIAANLDQQFSLADCQQLKQELAPRLNHNYNLLKHLVSQHGQLQRHYFDKLVDVH